MKELLVLIALLVIFVIPPLIAITGRMNDEKRKPDNQ